MMQFGDAKLPDRFWDKVQPCPMSGCWIWTGATESRGYGRYNHAGSVRRAHKVAFEVGVAEVPAFLDLDHRCRVRCCVNPEHLEPVTHAVNVLRGNAPAARLARMTSCSAGHAFDAANTIVRRRPSGRTYRRCRICLADYRKAS